MRHICWKAADKQGIRHLAMKHMASDRKAMPRRIHYGGRFQEMCNERMSLHGRGRQKYCSAYCEARRMRRRWNVIAAILRCASQKL